MGNKLVIGLAGGLVIGILAVGAFVAVLINLRGTSFGENRGFGELSLVEQTLTIGVIPAIIILAGVLPWWLGGFSLSQSLLLSIATHVVSIGIGLATQQPVMLLGALIVGWVVLPVMLSSDG